jgi:hypothetical protein
LDLLILGPDEQEFYISKDLICSQSEFFAAACSEQWETGRTNITRLKEDNPDAFTLFLIWLSTGTIEDSAELIDAANLDKKQDNGALTNEFLRLAECFVLGDALQAQEFCNYIVDVLIGKCNTSTKMLCSSDEAVEYVWTHTPRSSTLRRLILDNFAADIILDFDAIARPSAAAQEFYFELSKVAITAWRTKSVLLDVWKKDPCLYHKHADHPEGYAYTGKN